MCLAYGTARITSLPPNTVGRGGTSPDVAFGPGFSGRDNTMDTKDLQGQIDRLGEATAKFSKQTSEFAGITNKAIIRVDRAVSGRILELERRVDDLEKDLARLRSSDPFGVLK